MTKAKAQLHLCSSNRLKRATFLRENRQVNVLITVIKYPIQKKKKRKRYLYVRGSRRRTTLKWPSLVLLLRPQTARDKERGFPTLQLACSFVQTNRARAIISVILQWVVNKFPIRARKMCDFHKVVIFPYYFFFLVHAVYVLMQSREAHTFAKI